MKKCLKWVKISAKWHKFHLADKCLLIIMVILMIQTAYNLFFNEIVMHDSALDVAIRTTTAAIFGYFISANFHSSNKNISKNDSKNTNPVDIESSSDVSSLPKAKIGFNSDLRSDLRKQELNSGYTQNVTGSDLEPDDKEQIIIVASIGIVCLIFLLIARNYSIINTASAAALSQLRDFISGSVGFLIGQSTQHKK